jgi:predicted ATP-binding protein involved in virulence
LEIVYMSFLTQQIAPPKSWDEFEDLCLALFRAEWQDSSAQKNGRQGQKQAGVDVFGHNNKQGGGLWGVQCRGKHRGYGSKLTGAEIDAELAKADTFHPPLDHWIIATTTANDATLQTYAHNLSELRAAKQLCPVTLFFWESIEALLHTHPDVANRFYPEHFAHLSKTGKPLHLPAIRLSDFFADPLNHLAQLRRQLETTGSSALLSAAAVQGMGGVGKTQLALKYSLSFQAEYAGVWWLQAETLELLEQECLLFCAKQGLTLAPGESAAATMCAWLAEQERWLLVYDNVEDPTLLQRYLPRTGPHHVLITARRQGWEGMATLELDVWRKDEALQFLRARLAEVPDVGDDALRLLTQTLDGLPLALEQACAYIVNNQISVAAYCQRIQAHESAQRLLGKNDSEFCTRSVLATLSLAFEKLSEPAQALLGLCAWLAAEPIPEYLFTENTDELPPALQAQAADEFAWRETVGELESYALCQVRVSRMTDHVGNGAEMVPCLNFHRLTQAAVRASVHGEQAGGTALVLVRAAFPYQADHPQHWPRCRALLPHVQHLQACYQESWQQAVRCASLLAQLAVYLKYGPALYPQAESLERQALLIKQNALGEEHPDTLASISNLATTLSQMGDLPSAQALQEKALEIYRRVLGEEHPDTLTSINNMAETLRQMGDLPGARVLQEKALEIRRLVLGEEHPDTLTSINNLAGTLWQMGDLPGARLLQEKTLEIRRRLMGEEHPATLIAINNLAITLYHMGELPAAQSMMQQAFTSRRRVLGEEHPDTLITFNNLATLLRQMGDLPGARALQEEALEIRRRLPESTQGILPSIPPASFNHSYTFSHANEDKLNPTEFHALHRTWLQIVTLTQFRCFNTLEIDLSEQLTVLIAPNGAGKTTVLDGIAVAIGLFVQCFHGGKATPLLDTDARLLPTDLKLGLMEPQYPVKVTTQGEIDGKKFSLQYSRENPATEPTMGNAKPLTDIGKAMQNAVTRQQPVVLPLLAYFGTNRLQKNREASPKANDQQFEAAFFSRTAGYKDCLDPATNFKDFETWLIYAERADENPPPQTGNDTPAADNGFVPLLQAVRNAVDTCLATSGWQNLRLSRKRMRLVMSHPLQGELEIARLSDGVRNMIALVADIAQRAVRLNPHFGAEAAIKTPGLVLIDEVDLHLHPEWQQTVLTNLLTAFPNIQFVVTTHSPQVLTSVQPTCIRRIEWNGDQASLHQPEFSLGAESPQLLRSLQGVNPRPQHLPIVQKLNRYLTLTSEDKWDSDEALALRSELNAWGKAYEPSLVKADLDIRLRTARRARK